MDAQRLQTIYENAGRPGARTYRTEARRAGVQITQKEAQEFVSKQNKQVLQANLPSDGKITSSREDIRWMVDLIDFSKRRMQPGGYRYILCCIDVFSRNIWCERMTEKTDAQALTAYRRIVARNDRIHPQEVSSDLGREWGPTFQAYLKDNGTVWRTKDPQSVNSIGAVDAGIGQVKKILANLQLGNDTHWATLLKKAVDLYNDRGHGALYGESPEDLDSNKVVSYLKEAEHGEATRHNNEMWRKKAGRLRDLGAFRVPKKRSTWPRIDEAKFSGKVHKTGQFTGANVNDETGKSYPVRKLLAVAEGSESVVINEEAVPGSGKREDQRRVLRPYAEQLRQEISSTARNEISFERAKQFLRTRPAFTDTSDVYRVPRQARYSYFFRLFGFQLRGSGEGMTVGVPAARAGVAAGQPAARAVELAPRAQRRDMPGTQAILFQPDNPKRGGSAAFARWALYRSATTVAEARRLGMTPQDLQADIARGFARLQ